MVLNSVNSGNGNTLVAGTLDAGGDFKIAIDKFKVIATSGDSIV